MITSTVGLVGQAAAHTELTGSDPADGATLSSAPTAITLTFNESVQDVEPVIALTGPDGQPYPTSAPTIDGGTMRSDVQAVGPAGTYTIAYRVVSVDGHPVTGQLEFELAAAVIPAPAPPAVSPTQVIATPPVISLPSTASTSPAVASAAGTSPPTTSPADPSPVSSSLDSSTAAVPALAATGTDTDGSSGPSAWVWAVLGILAVLSAAAAVVVRQRRQRAAGDG